MKKSFISFTLIVLSISSTTFANDEVQFATQEDEKAFDSLLKNQPGQLPPAAQAVKQNEKKFLRNAAQDIQKQNNVRPQNIPSGAPNLNSNGPAMPPSGMLPPPPRPNGIPGGQNSNSGQPPLPPH